jgi:hypothetical protein
MNKKLKQASLVLALFGVAGLVLSRASATGKVTYKGKPVPYALVVMMNGQSSATGAADAHGNYTVMNAPPGKVRVGVNTAAGRGMQMSAMMASQQGGDKSLKPTFLDIPPKFFDPETSGLEVEVKNSAEPTSLDIEIK